MTMWSLSRTCFSFYVRANNQLTLDFWLVGRGGVGLNPFLSILRSLDPSSSSSSSSSSSGRRRILPPRVTLLLASKESEVYCLDRLESLSYLSDSDVTVYLSPSESSEEEGGTLNTRFGVERRRLQMEDVRRAIVAGTSPSSSIGDGRERTLVYVCGPPPLTDEVVQFLLAKETEGGAGMFEKRVRFEKWW
jgi:ferredoxin-NADP reductase